ncbi:phenylacetaldoxime dehydratase family protein [Streptomyces sp. TRM76323]|uniref:Phenylacetaldoxime dehydratase family protein n=1 Tax=Streptomyces tamarix TaxID=3078565 RepID=A0ABU3QTT2_9ACTN|nr:phenylacetaldoxime dehydratase family protein [Streptomyces tamarix]MDT9685909.1 phenylacetaldoxime dehydratase family protein [Streptomyces tamarix]
MTKNSSAPPQHTPRFPAFTGVFPSGCTGYVMGQYGVQSASGAIHERAAAEMRERFQSANRPDVVNRGSFTDSSGLTNTMWFAYWLEPARHRSWVAEGKHSSPVQGAGWWWEEALIPVESTETLHTHQQEQYPTSGLAEILDQESTELHDYWGSARDRMRKASVPPTRGAALGVHDSTVDVVVEGGICLIRTAQDWSGSSVFRERFLQKVQPVMKKGVTYLGEHPETGCICTREISEQDMDGHPLDRACTVAWFVSLDHLLSWTHHHETHLRIYRSFFSMLQEEQSPLDIALWHEVSVLPPGSVRARYVGCHPTTGLLPLGLSPHE